MALQLETLSFVVDSSQLDEARIKIAKLGDAVNSLNKPMQQMAVSSAKTAEAVAKSEQAAEKARVAKEKLADSASTVTAKVDPLTKLMEKLSNTYTDMAAGMTRGESSILNQARSYGAMGDQLKAVADILQNIKTLNKDPFDASLGGVRSITQEFERLQQRADLAAQGILMTTKQLGEYSKLAAEARGRVVGLGMDPDSLEGQKVYNQLLSQSQKEYLDVLSVVKQLTDAEQQRLAVAKEQERLQKAAASASAARMQEWAKGVGGKSPELSSMAAFYKEQEVAARKLTAAEDDLILREQKLAFVNKELAAGLTTASANALFKYQKDLEALGKSTDEITKRTTAFRAGLVEKQGHSPIKKIADDAKAAREQVDHLSRAIGVQLGDVAVSLAGGMNPFQVLIQQGDQLRFAVQNAKEEGKDLDLAMTNAVKSIYTSFVDTGKVIGGFFVNAVKTTGAAITGTASDILGVTALINYLNDRLTKAGYNTDAYSKSLEAISGVLRIVSGIIGVSFVAALVAAAVAALQLEKEQTALAQAVAKSGATFGASTQEAIALSKSLSDVGISSGKATQLMVEMISAGNISKESFKGIAQAAADIETYVGVKASDSIKKFSDTIKDPIKELYEFGIQTGFVSEEQIKLVQDLLRTGDEVKAQELAVKLLEQGYKEMAETAKGSMSSLDRTLIEVKKTLSELWDSFKQSEPVAEGFRVAWETVAGVFIDIWSFAKMAGDQIGGTAAILALLPSSIANMDFTAINDIRKEMLANEKLFQDQAKASMKAVMDRSKVEQSTSAEQRRQTSQSLRVMQEADKIRTEAMSSLMKLEKERKQVIADMEITERRRDISGTARAEMLGALKLKLAKIDDDIAKENKKNNAEGLSAAKKLEDQRKKDLNVYEDIMNKSEGLNKVYNDSVNALTRSVKVGDITQQEYTAAFQALYEQQPGYIKQQQEMKKGVDDLNKSTTDFNNKILESQAATAKEREELASMTAMLGMTEEQQKTYMIEYQKSLKLKQLDIDLEKELRAIRQDPSIADNPYIQYDREQKAIQANAAKRQLVEDQASYEIAKKQAEEFKKVQDDISGIIADALFEGGKKGADSLKNYLKTTFRKYVIDVIINPIVGSLMGASGVQGASSSLLGNMGSSLLSNAVTGISGVASAFGTAFSNAALSTVQGWVGMSGTAAQMGTSLANAGYFAGSAAGTTASGIGASIGAYAPYALAAVVALDQLGVLDRWGGDPDAFLVQQATGTRQSYSTSTTSALGTIGFVNGRGTIMKNGRLVSEKGETEGVPVTAQNTALELIRNLDNAIASTLSESQISTISKNLSGWYKKSWSFEGKMLEDWIASRYETILRGLDGSFGKVKDYQKEGEKLSETTVRLITNLTTVYGAFETLGISTRNVSAKFSTNLVEMLGGVSNFSSAMQYFYENFYSEEERFRNQSKSLKDSFAALGLAVPKTRDEFKKLLEGALSSGNTGLSGKLIALMQPFNDFISATEEVAVSVSSITEEYARLTEKIMTNEEIAQQRIDLEQRLFEATASQAQIAAKARGEIAGYNLALYDQVIAAEASKKAEEARLEEVKKAEEARLEAEKVILDQRKSLQDEYFALTASQEQIAAKARSEIDASNLAIYDMVVAVKAAKAAEELRLEEFKKAEEARLEAERKISDERANLQQRLFEATATEAQILAKARSEISAYNVALYDQVIAAENAKKAEEARAEAERVVLEQRKSLQDRLFEATATEAQMAAKARSEIDRSNLALYDQVIAAENAKNAMLDMQNAIEQMTDSLMSEIDRLKGVIIGDAGVTGDVAGLSSEFAILSARAKTGESKAIEMLPEYSKAIESAVAASAVSASDLVYARAWLASSLGNTAGALTGVQDVTIPNSLLSSQTSTNASSVISSSTSSQSELIAALISEVQGLRAEVRADVSANTKTSKILERVNQDGETLSVTTA